jgi:hypothetical protein
MVKLPPWDTPDWRLARELRTLYAAVNRVHELEATPGASPVEIASAQRAVAARSGGIDPARRCAAGLQSEASDCMLFRESMTRPAQFGGYALRQG